MAEFVSDCPRCGARKSTHDVFSSVIVGTQYRWMQIVELSCICRTCRRMSIHLVSRKEPKDEHDKFFKDVGSINTTSTFAGSLNQIVDFKRHVSVWDTATLPTPEHLPLEVEQVVKEANRCMSANCWNAASAMYRLALDLVTKALLPESGEPASKIRRSLGLRLDWLFDNDKLPPALRELAHCVKEDGNDGAHVGILTKENAEDLQDFAYRLLDRVVSEPKRLELAAERRIARRNGGNGQ
jgi:hypothetical protein